MVGEANSPSAALCGVSLALLASAAPVSAQNRNATAGTLEEIVVTATRAESDLQKTPVSVTAVTGEDLARRGTVNLLDLVAFTPNLVVASVAGNASTRSSFAIRGMGVGAQDSTGAVGVYVDEVFFPSNYGNVLGLMDVERIEVLRGPQGTLFGRNTIAGAVQYVSVKPGNDVDGYAEATGANLGTYSAKAALNLPLGDIAAVRISGLKDHRGGFVTDDLRNVDIGASTTDAGRLQVRLSPLDSLTVDLKAELYRQTGNGRGVAVLGVNSNAQFPAQASLRGEPRALTSAYVSADNYHIAGFNTPDSFESRQQSYAATVSYELTDAVRLKSISAYQDNVSRAVQDADMTPLSILVIDRGTITDRVFTQELQLAGRSFSDRLNWTVGAYYYDGSSRIIGNYSLTGVTGTPTTVAPTANGLAVPNFQADTQYLTKALAGYAQGTFSLNDQWSVTLGARYSDEEIDNALLNPTRRFVSTYSDVSPHIGVNYQITDDAMLYVKGSKGFRAGGLTVNSNLSAGFLPFDPETAWTYEAGARLEFLDRRVRVNPTVFYTDWTDIQFNYRQNIVPAPPAPVVATQNAGDATVKGAELEMQFAATDKLVLTGSVSYLDAKYTQVPEILLTTYPQGFFAPANTRVTVVNLDVNQPLQQAPEFKYSVGGRYTRPLSNNATLTGSLDWGWTDEMRSVVTTFSAITLPSYGVLNGRLEYQAPDNRWSMALYGTNLLDEYYLTGGNAFGRSYSIGVDEGDLGRPREYGLTARFNF